MFGCKSLSFLQLGLTHQHLRHLDLNLHFQQDNWKKTKIYSFPNQEELEKPIEFKAVVSHTHAYV